MVERRLIVLVGCWKSGLVESGVDAVAGDVEVGRNT